MTALQCLWTVSGTQAFPGGSLYSAFYESSSINCLGPSAKMGMPEDKHLSTLRASAVESGLASGGSERKKGLQLNTWS